VDFKYDPRATTRAVRANVSSNRIENTGGRKITLYETTFLAEDKRSAEGFLMLMFVKWALHQSTAS
jgi:hypothetical protein